MSQQRDYIKKTSKFNSLWGTFRDFTYDAVFHVGDTAQNFLWDSVYGPSDNRSQKYHSRQIDKHDRKSEKPLNMEERTVFAKILMRSKGEKLLDYWRRQKALLNYSDKQSLVQQYREKEKFLAALKKKDNSVQNLKEIKRLEKQFRAIKQIPSYQRQSLK